LAATSLLGMMSDKRAVQALTDTIERRRYFIRDTTFWATGDLEVEVQVHRSEAKEETVSRDHCCCQIVG